MVSGKLVEHSKIAPFSPQLRSRPRWSPSKRREQQTDERVTKQEQSWEWIEKVLWLAFVGMIWITGVVFVLQWLRFPFHLHRALVAGILFVPLILLAGLFSIVDSCFMAEEKP